MAEWTAGGGRAVLEEGDARSQGGPEDLVLSTLGGTGADTGPGTRRHRNWRTRARLAAAAGSVLALAAAVTVPIELAGVATVSHAAGGVFSRPTVRLVLSESGTPQLRGYAVALTLSNPAGKAVSAAGAKDDVEISVLHGRADLVDLLETRSSLYLRLNPSGIDRVAAAQGHRLNLARDLDRIAGRDSKLSYLRTLARGGWLGFRLGQLRPYLAKIERGLRASGKKLSHEGTVLRHAFKLSFAEAWDAWASLHVVSRRSGTTEYRVKLPVQAFVRSFAASFERRIKSSVPALAKELPAVNRSIDRIPSAEKLPVDLWIRAGDLVKVAVSYHGQTLAVAISQPRAELSAPRRATYVTVKQVVALLRYAVARAVSGASPAALGGSNLGGADPFGSSMFGSSGIGSSVLGSASSALS